MGRRGDGARRAAGAPAGVAPDAAALLGCAVSTGYGVVTNVAEVRAGDTVVVFGVGGIGVAAIQTAAGPAACIVAVDVDAAKDVARRFGADAFVVPARIDDAATVAALITAEAGAPVDVTVECSGAVVAIETAIRVLGPGGRAALVGIPPRGTEVAFDVNALFVDRRIVGSYNGNVEVAAQLPEIVDHVRHGRLLVDEQASHVWPLAEIHDALAAVRAGSVVRAVLHH
ncbi:MAG: zinc-binding dehydrogenase [Acidimicrobiia bacterium]